MELHVFNEEEAVIRGLADFVVQVANDSITAAGFCNLVLSGGNSPKQLYRLLSSAAYRDKIEWQKLYFFFGDERYVPPTDDSNNGKMAKENLFEPLRIAEKNVFYINTALHPDDAAMDYANRIIGHFDGRPLRFDLVLLGLGDNAHTASLFPHTKVLSENKALAAAVYVEELAAYRITLTAPLINQSRNIAFLVYGETKAEAVFNVLQGERNAADFPAQLVNSEEGTTHWFLDRGAAALLLEHQQ